MGTSWKHLATPHPVEFSRGLQKVFTGLFFQLLQFALPRQKNVSATAVVIQQDHKSIERLNKLAAILAFNVPGHGIIVKVFVLTPVFADAFHLHFVDLDYVSHSLILMPPVEAAKL
jgi:hypothetical protein